MILFGCFSSLASSQEVLTLQACLDKVEKNSLRAASELSLLNSSKVNKQFHWWTLLPNLSANVGINASFGRRLDPFTNTFATSSVNSQSFGLNSSMQVFNGFSYFHKQQVLRATIERDEVSLDKKRNELKLRAIETYLDLCKLSVQTELAKLRMDKYLQIQEIQRLLIKEGRIHVIDTLKSHNTFINEQDLLRNLTNESCLKFIDLNFQMGEPLRSIYSVDLSSVDALEQKMQFDEAYQVKKIEIETEILENAIKTERAEILPGISLGGLLGTGFSTNNKDYLLAEAPTKSYSRQINENLYEGVGIYLTVPLFNHGEWLKSKRIHSIQQEELENRKELINQQLERHVLELEQKTLNLKAKREQCKQMSDNLEIVYTKSLLLYKEGRLTYPEMERTFMEWQLKLAEYETLYFDLQLLKLFD
jgi:outer membrane protein